MGEAGGSVVSEGASRGREVSVPGARVSTRVGVGRAAVGQIVALGMLWVAAARSAAKVDWGVARAAEALNLL